MTIILSFCLTVSPQSVQVSDRSITEELMYIKKEITPELIKLIKESQSKLNIEYQNNFKQIKEDMIQLIEKSNSQITSNDLNNIIENKFSSMIINPEVTKILVETLSVNDENLNKKIIEIVKERGLDNVLNEDKIQDLLAQNIRDHLSKFFLLLSPHTNLVSVNDNIEAIKQKQLTSGKAFFYISNCN